MDNGPASVRLLQPEGLARSVLECDRQGNVTANQSNNHKENGEVLSEIGRLRIKPSRFVLIGFVLGVAIMGSILLLVVLGGNSESRKNGMTDEISATSGLAAVEDKELVCLTNGCIETAIDIRRSMNKSVDPCDNFYEFACGRYVPARKEVANPNEGLIHKYNRIIEDKLLTPSMPNDHAILKYARKVYQNCLKANETDDSENVRLFIRKIMGLPQWPNPSMTALNLDKNYYSEKAADLILGLSLTAFFKVELTMPTIERGHKQGATNEKFMFKISSPNFDFPSAILTSQSSINYLTKLKKSNYENFVATILAEFGWLDPKFTTTTKLGSQQSQNNVISEEIIGFEIALGKLISKHTNETGFEEFTVRQLENLLRDSTNSVNGQKNSKISIRSTLDRILKKIKRSPMKDNEKVIVFNSTVLANVLSLVSNTSDSILTNYMGYRLAMKFVPFARNLTILQNSSVSSTPSGDPEACLNFVNTIFTPVLTRFGSPFDENIAESIQDIFTNIKKELAQRINQNRRMSYNRKLESTLGINLIQTCQQNWIMSESDTSKYYAGIYPLENSYLQQLFSLSSWHNTKTMNNYNKIISDELLCDSYTKLSAYFVPQFLRMSIPPTYWLEPFYNRDWPVFLKYSGIADIIGHEFMHALFSLVPEWIDNPNNKEFSLKSINFVNDFIDIKELVTKTMAAKQSILQKITKPILNSRCIIDHYENYTLDEEKYGSVLTLLLTDGAKINGTQTFEENVCDIGGIQLAFAAYQSAIKKPGQLEKTEIVSEKGLPGLSEYSNEKIFFLNYARKWCDIEISSRRSLLLLIDEHSPPEYRVLGVLRNNPDFARVWQCPAGSYMNSKTKCRIF